MPKPSRRQIQHEHLRKQILEAASAAFASEGFEQLSMRKLAADVGCVPGTLYLYFRDKDDLLRAVVETSFAELLKELQSIPDTGDPASNLKARLHAYIEFGLRNPNHYKCAFVLQAASPRPYTPRPAFAELTDAVANCMRPTGDRAAEIAIASQVAWACIHGLTSLLIARPTFPWADREKLINEMIEAATAGIVRRRRPHKNGGKNGKSSIGKRTSAH